MDILRQKVRREGMAAAKDTIEEIYEPFLIQEGFLDRTPRGRMATANAYRHWELKASELSQKELF